MPKLKKIDVSQKAEDAMNEAGITTESPDKDILKLSTTMAFSDRPAATDANGEYYQSYSHGLTFLSMSGIPTTIMAMIAEGFQKRGVSEDVIKDVLDSLPITGKMMLGHHRTSLIEMIEETAEETVRNKKFHKVMRWEDGSELRFPNAGDPEIWVPDNDDTKLDLDYGNAC